MRTAGNEICVPLGTRLQLSRQRFVVTLVAQMPAGHAFFLVVPPWRLFRSSLDCFLMVSLAHIMFLAVFSVYATQADSFRRKQKAKERCAGPVSKRASRLSMTTYHATGSRVREALSPTAAACSLVRYVAALSHDFGTPISALQMAITQLQQLDLPSSTASLLSGMTAALEVMTALKRKAIDIGTLQHGDMLSPERTSVDLRQIIKSKLPALAR